MRHRYGLLLVAALVAASPSHAQGLPPGHPGAASAQPAAIEEDSVMVNPSIAPGTIHVRLVDPDGAPLPHVDVKLSSQFNKIAEGEKKTEQHVKTDDNGVAVFGGLPTGGDFNYRAVVNNGPAEYASDPIQLKPDAGVVALLHVYPVTRSVQEAGIGGILFVYVETRDDVFQFEILVRYGNRSRVSWVPEDARMELPAGFKAFKAGEAMTDVRFEEDPGHGAKLRGTFAPGQQSASFRFQVPRQGESQASFHLGLPPHIGEARFIAEAAPTMEIDVDGFEKPQVDVSQTGQRVLVTRRVAVRGQSNGLPGFTAQLSGIPTPGWGRWLAVLVASGLAALGFAASRGRLGRETQAELQERDAARAKRVLLDELVYLTRARQEERVGPSTYESARRVLVEALSRVISQNPALAKRAKRSERKKAARNAEKGSSA
ncbi:MAG TPA: carboxypeptidase-like regulatory domain-containing protein [Polyangiaceae bacterium]|nr:carboxypeptidase-like regulatory domain-containing protein [Polyangiaceae bacterium]